MSTVALASALPTICAYFALSVFVFGFRHRSLFPAFGSVSMSNFRVIWRDSSRLLIAQIADTVIACASNVLVASRLGSARVPEVSVSLSVMMIFSFVCCMFLLPLWPAYVEAEVRGDWFWIRRAFTRGALRSTGAIVACCLVYCVAYKAFLHAWSPALPVPPLGFVVTLSLWFLAYVWNKNAMVLLNGLGHTSIRGWVAPLSAAVFISGAVLWLPSAGIIAIPLAGIAASVTEALFTSTKAFAILFSKTEVPPNISEGAYAAEV
jgi:hypothetical protein